MTVREIQELLSLEVVAGAQGLERNVVGGYCGDLLSDVMGHADNGMMWITIQSHKNIVAVALLKELSAVILAHGHRPDDDTRTKAEAEGIPILLSPLPIYQLAGQLFDAGIGLERR
jgi:predicted transcriptional regulator